MKNVCNIIKDLLPLYSENLASEETKIWINQHLADCEDCRKVWGSMEEPPKLSDKVGIAPLQDLKKKLLKKRVATITFTVAVVLVILMTGFAFLTSPQYLLYSNDILTLVEGETGSVVVAFGDEVTGYTMESELSKDGQTSVYRIEAWKTVWDTLFSNNGRQNAVFRTNNGNPMVIYYNPNNDVKEVRLYGKDPDGNGVWVLPRLALIYYLTAMVMAALALTVLLFLFRKKPAVKRWIERGLLFPVAYMGGHLAVKGFSTISYSMQRDFFIILLVTIFLYLACLLGLYLYRVKKEDPNG